MSNEPRSAVEAAFGKNVRAAREAVGMSQEDVAQAMTDAGCRLAASQVAKIERAERPTSVRELLLLGEVLHVGESVLLGSKSLDPADIAAIVRDEQRRRLAAKVDLAEHNLARARLYMDEFENGVGVSVRRAPTRRETP